MFYLEFKYYSHPSKLFSEQYEIVYVLIFLKTSLGTCRQKNKFEGLHCVEHYCVVSCVYFKK